MAGTTLPITRAVSSPRSRTAARPKQDRATIPHAISGERARLARHVHDGLLQHIFAVRMANARLEEMALSPEAADLVGQIHFLLDQMNREARISLAILDPGELPDGIAGLGDVAQFHVQRLGMLFGVTASTQIADEPMLPVGVLTELFGVIQEACNNLGRHARPSSAGIRGYRLGWRYVVTIYDDGPGFDVAERTRGFGLRSMRQRCESMSARLAFRSRPGHGTVVRVSIPLADGS
jgi:signal transduction histidine kinase